MKFMQNAAGTVMVIAIYTLAAARMASDEEPTAFSLIKEGNRYLGEQSKDKVVQIRSEKSIGTLIPNIWHIVYYDPDATLKAVEVTFGSGKKRNVSHPLRLLEPITGGDKMLDRSKFKVDSDKAIRTAIAEPLLKSLTLKATQLWLEGGAEGSVWRVRLWAAKLKDPAAMADIGEVCVSADDGKVVRTDLKINRID